MAKWKLSGKSAATCQLVRGIMMSVDKSAIAGKGWFFATLGIRSEPIYESREKAMSECESYVMSTLNKCIAILQE